MLIRTTNDRDYTQGEKEFIQKVHDVLTPIFKEYDVKFTYEKMYYLACNECNDIILDELYLKKTACQYKEKKSGDD